MSEIHPLLKNRAVVHEHPVPALRAERPAFKTYIPGEQHEPQYMEFLGKYLKKWPITIPSALAKELKPGQTIVAKILAAIEAHSDYAAPIVWAQRKTAHAQAICSGDVDVLAAFPNSAESTAHDFRAKRSALTEALRYQNRKSRPAEVAVLQEVLRQVSEIRSKLQDDDVARFNDLGVPPEFSHPTRVFATWEQGLAATIERYPRMPDENSAASNLRTYLPAALHDQVGV